MPTQRETSADRLRFNPLGAHADGTDVSSAATLTPPAGAGKLMLQALDQNVRYTLDGTTPTATKGFQLKAGDPPIILGIGGNTVVKLIEEAATADIQLQFGE